MFAQLSNEIASLREQLAARETELAEIKQLKAAPAQNGLPSNDQLKVRIPIIGVFTTLQRFYGLVRRTYLINCEDW